MATNFITFTANEIILHNFSINMNFIKIMIDCKLIHSHSFVAKIIKITHKSYVAHLALENRECYIPILNINFLANFIYFSI